MIKHKNRPLTFKLLYGLNMATLAASLPTERPLLFGGGSEIIDTDNFIADPEEMHAVAPEPTAVVAVVTPLILPLFAEDPAVSFDETGRIVTER